MMCKLKKISSLVLAATLLFLNIQTASALTDKTTVIGFSYPVRYGSEDLRYPDYKMSSGVSETLETYVDLDILKDYLTKSFASCPEAVYVIDFSIPYSSKNATALRQYIWHEIPELFHINGIGFYLSDDYIYAITASYHYTEQEYKTMLSKSEKAAAKLLDGIKGNNNLTDVQKALLLHDRIAVSCEYSSDTSLQECYNFYGVFVNKNAVCMGYTFAYAYLLSQVGIESTYCASDSLNHAWNIVYIDGIPYHVDVTWDDPTADISGRVRHKNFLRSTDGIVATGHFDTEIDYISTPTDTRYDSYFWQNSNTAFQLVDNDIYYIDSQQATLNKIENGVTTTCKNISEKWQAGTNSYWSGHFGMLAFDGKDLLYSLSKAVYKYDTETGVSSAVFNPDLTAGNYYRIFGFKYENCELICEVTDSPNFTSSTKAERTQKKAHHVSSDYWITDIGSSSTATGIKHRECISCGIETESATIPKVAITTLSAASANYNTCTLFTDMNTCDNINKLIFASGTTSISAVPSHSTNGNLLYGTGSAVEIYNDGEHIYDFTLIVNGDLNGDTVCDALDIALTERYSNGVGSPTKNEIYAANKSVSDIIDANTYQRVVNTALAS